MNSKLFTIIMICFIIFICFRGKLLYSDYNLSNLEMFHNNYKFVTDCRFQQKKCPSGLVCDCKEYCGDPLAKLVKTNIEFYCYTPLVGTDCTQGYGSWVLDKTWKCIPKYPGIFTTSGEQIMGKYPHSKKYNKLIATSDSYQFKIDCTGLTDEYGNKLRKLTFDSGIEFCVKDYCLNNILGNPANGYNVNTGLCDCTDRTENLIKNDKTSPCVLVGDQQSQSSPTLRVNCFTDESYVKDVVSNYLVKCPPESQTSKYIDAYENDFKIVEVYK